MISEQSPGCTVFKTQMWQNKISNKVVIVKWEVEIQHGLKHWGDWKKVGC